MASSPATIDLNTYRGDTFEQEFRLIQGGDPFDLTGATVVSQARSVSYASTANKSLVVEIDTPPTDGKITLSLPPAISPGEYLYDIEVTKDTIVRTWVKGKLTIERDITNA